MTSTLRRSTTFTARMEPEQKAELAERARAMKLTKAEILRRAVSAYLANDDHTDAPATTREALRA